MGECYPRRTGRHRRRQHPCQRGKENVVHDGQTCPYSNENSDADEHYHGGLSDDVAFMGVEELRMQTFRSWSPAAPVTARDLAREGFFYLGPGDRVQCAFCRRVLHSWRPGDNVREEHRRVNPRCPFLRGRQTNVPLQNIARLPTRNQTGHLQQPPAPVSQARQAVQPSGEATSTRGQQPSDESSGAVGGGTYSYSTTSGSESSSYESNLPPKARMALLEGPSQLQLPAHASFELGTVSASKAPSQPASTGTGSGAPLSQVSPEEPGQAGKIQGSLPRELPREPSSFPGTRPAAARASSLEQLGSTGSRKASSSESHGELATFPGSTEHRKAPEAHGKLATFPVNRAIVPRQLPSVPVQFGSQVSQSSTSSDESSLLDAKVDLYMSSPAVEAVRGMGFTVSDEDLHTLTLRLLLEQSRGFTSSELAQVLMDMESLKLTADQVSLPVAEGSDKLSMAARSQPTPQAKPLAPSGAFMAPSSSAASPSAPASLTLLARSLSSNSGGDREDVFSCKICMDRDVQVTFEPCGHLVCCEICSNQIVACPLCRHPINRRVRTYLS